MHEQFHLVALDDCHNAVMDDCITFYLTGYNKNLLFLW